DDAATNIDTCENPGEGYATQAGDCNDNDLSINPGATEVCDGIDNDCDSLIDDDDPDVTGQSTWYADADGDGFGDPNTTLESCGQPEGYVADNTDCNDDWNNGGAAINPGATEICDGIDNNCDGQIDEGVSTTTYYVDNDGDGYGVDDAATNIDTCENPGAGYATQAGDCDDTNNSIYPGAVEIADDGIDQDCDGKDLVTGDNFTGCTTGFWKNTDTWCNSYSKTDNFFTVFNIGIDDYHNLKKSGNLNLQEALEIKGGGFSKLARQATTALLNACNNEINYAYSLTYIIESVQEVFASGSKFDANRLGNLFEEANKAGCPLDNSNMMPSNSKYLEIDYSQLTIYPNPLEPEGVWLEFSAREINEDFEIRVYDLYGRQLTQTSISVSKEGGSYFWPLDHSGWEQGIYILRATSNSQEFRRKLMK
ncbi:putative secreted protein (Por secretion system target), partial [Christiangramia gaetbulicola]